MTIPNSIRDSSIVRIALQVDGSFNDTLELTGAQLRKLISLLGPAPVAVVPKMVAGDAAAEKRENTPQVTIERRGETPVVPATAPPITTGDPLPPIGQTGDDLNAPQTVSETPAAPETPALPTETPDLGE